MSIRQRQQSSSSNTSSNPSNSPPPPSPSPSTSISQRALQSTAHLANLLPTGTLLAFQLLTPLFTSNGVCDSATRPLTFILLIVLSFSCFLACFTDSFKGSSDNQIYYGFATPNGLWVFDSEAAKGAGIPDLRKYKLGFIDVVHAVLSVMVFFAVAFRDKNVINCFYPAPKHETEEVLDIVPIGVGLICSLLFVVFPTRRHGIGFPVTSSSDQTNHVS